MGITILIKPQFSLFCTYTLLFYYFYKSERSTFNSISSEKQKYRKVTKFEYGLKKPVVELIIIKLQDLIQPNRCVQSTFPC